MIEPERVYSISEVAWVLRMHPNTIRKAERAGRIPPIRRQAIGRCRYFTLAEVDRLGEYFYGDYWRASRAIREARSAVVHAKHFFPPSTIEARSES